jgi:hypothetical protein
MASTISTPLTTRIPNQQADELRSIAAVSGTTVSSLLASLVANNLPELRSAA